MMKHIFLVVFLFSLPVRASINMPQIDASLFIPRAKTDFESVVYQNESLKRSLVRQLFEQDLLTHTYTKAYEVKPDFSNYYHRFASFYSLADLDNDSDYELIFNGFINNEAESERLEIYAQFGEKLQKVFQESGRLLAYTIHPNTGEILLYHHQYPCCNNASHNINRLRLVNEKLYLLKWYFVAREGNDMKGSFFPDSTVFSGKYDSTPQKVTLYWSDGVIDSEAWIGRSPTNQIGSFEKGSVFGILAQRGGWYYVIMCSPPRLEPNMVINPHNFSETKIFGWLKKSDVKKIKERSSVQQNN